MGVRAKLCRMDSEGPQGSGHLSKDPKEVKEKVVWIFRSAFLKEHHQERKTPKHKCVCQVFREEQGVYLERTEQGKRNMR